MVVVITGAVTSPAVISIVFGLPASSVTVTVTFSPSVSGRVNWILSTVLLPVIVPTPITLP